jgi:hypothetical protein
MFISCCFHLAQQGNILGIITPLWKAGLATACNFTAFWFDHFRALPRRIKTAQEGR